MQLEVKEMIALIEYIKEAEMDDCRTEGLYRTLDEILYDLRSIKEKLKIREDLHL